MIPEFVDLVLRPLEFEELNQPLYRFGLDNSVYGKPELVSIFLLLVAVVKSYVLLPWPHDLSVVEIEQHLNVSVP